MWKRERVGWYECGAFCRSSRVFKWSPVAVRLGGMALIRRDCPWFRAPSPPRLSSSLTGSDAAGHAPPNRDNPPQSRRRSGGPRDFS
eukprot:CAMPEP_0172619060 /NCGR_PEP_ID=MMETSP1068-20121228/89502_1 /TAXON_ID=35684 /ORGANISM="Pseudopedinella elastica, Strain CCMP716" /LENGTH=86 /DNA_ID=CAMNT_0013425615 /DNA_START=44 /DNA_END=300 /DNA_ORIENTATION=+